MSAITTESLRKVYPPPSGRRKPTSGWSPFPSGDGGPRPSGEVVALNRAALEYLPGVRRLEVVAGATHLFDEPGTLDEVTRLAGDWFIEHLAGGAPAPG